jgi:hypothetical protein
MTDPQPIDAPDAPDDEPLEPSNDVVPELDPEAETESGIEPTEEN